MNSLRQNLNFENEWCYRMLWCLLNFETFYIRSSNFERFAKRFEGFSLL